MIPASVIVTVLILLICAAVASLWLDARERRMDRQLAAALPASHAASLPSIRRLETKSRWQFLQRLANYRVGIDYTWHPVYVLLVGVMAAAAVVYAVRPFEFTTPTVSTAAAIVALVVVRG